MLGAQPGGGGYTSTYHTTPWPRGVSRLSGIAVLYTVSYTVYSSNVCPSVHSVTAAKPLLSCCWSRLSVLELVDWLVGWAVFYIPGNTVEVIWETVFTVTLDITVLYETLLYLLTYLVSEVRYGLDIGLPDLPYFTGAPIFQVISPVSRLKPIRETLSPVFWLLWILLHDLAVLQIYQQRKLTFYSW